MSKLCNRVPAVLAGEPITLEDQLAQWEQRKAMEVAARSSCVDGVPTAQPALALVQKVIDRVTAAGVPNDLIPEELTSVAVSAGGDAENALRTKALEFMATVRVAEKAVEAARRDGAGADDLADTAAAQGISAKQWRQHWPFDVDYDATGIPRAVVHWPQESD